MAYAEATGLASPVNRLPHYLTFISPSLASTVIDASGEKIAQCGRVVWKGTDASKTINKIGLNIGTRTGTVSTIKVSLQDADLTNGPPMRPDETADQYRDHAITDFTSNTWFTSGLVTSDGTDTGSKRTVNFGERLCVVTEFASFTAAELLNLRFASNGAAYQHQSQVMLKGGAGPSWSSTPESRVPNLVIEFSDGTFGTLAGAFVVEAFNTVTYNSGTGGADEYGNQFKVPFPRKINWAGALVQPASDFDLVFYNDTTVLDTQTVDAQHITTTSQLRTVEGPMNGDYEVSANSARIMAVKPNATNILLHYWDVNATGHWQCHEEGADCKLMSRVDGGAWSEVNSGKRRGFIWLHASAFDDGAGGGGGGGGQRVIGG